MTVMPGLVDAHNHLVLTYKPEPESNIYCYTSVADSTALRAIQGGLERHPDARVRVHDRPRHGQHRQLRGHGAAAGDRAGLDSRAAIIKSGIVIGGMGGQFFPTPEMARQHNIVYPEYLDADTDAEIVKAVRQKCCSARA